MCKPTEETVLGLLRYKDGWLEFNVPYQHKYGCIRDDYDTEKTVTGKQSLSVGPCMLDLIFVQYWRNSVLAEVQEVVHVLILVGLRYNQLPDIYIFTILQIHGSRKSAYIFAYSSQIVSHFQNFFTDRLTVNFQQSHKISHHISNASLHAVFLTLIFHNINNLTHVLRFTIHQKVA